MTLPQTRSAALWHDNQTAYSVRRIRILSLDTATVINSTQVSCLSDSKNCLRLLVRSSKDETDAAAAIVRVGRGLYMVVYRRRELG